MTLPRDSGGPLAGRAGITLLEASAGTGKTFCIAQEVLRLVANLGLPIERIVVLTFTRAATSELRDRVRRRLRDGLDGVELRLGKRPTWRPPDAVARSWYEELHGASAAEAERRLRKALVDFDEAAIWTIDRFCGQMLQRYAFECGVSFGARTVTDAKLWQQQLARDFYTRITAQMDPALVTEMARCNFTLAGLEALAWATERTELVDDPLPPQVLPAVTNPRDLEQVWSLVWTLRSRFLANARRELPGLLEQAGTRTHATLLRQLHTALMDQASGPALGKRMAGDFDAALVDEFQDTDPIQWAIFARLFSQRLVLIGDPKQAIYRFRGADIHAYQAAAGVANHTDRDQLATNYRSDAALVGAVNHLYSRPAYPFGTWIRYKPIEAHHPTSRLSPPRPPLVIRMLPRDGSGRFGNGRAPKPIFRGWLEKVLPDRVASEIQAELAAGGTIAGEDGEPRPVTAADCAVLVRTNPQAKRVRAALRRRGVPAIIRSDARVFDAAIRSDLERVLAAIAQPTDAWAVRSALATRLMGRTATQIEALDTDAASWQEAAIAFGRWGRTWTSEGFIAALRAFLDDDDVIERVLKGPDGDRDLGDLMHLGELMAEAQARHRLGPTALIEWLRQAGPGLPDPDDAIVRLESDAPAVAVVTIHRAKGLEYPLVWCPYAYKEGFMTDEDQANLEVWDPDLDKRVLDLRIVRDKDSRLKRRRWEDFEENLRLVYVALTRARHRCVLYWGVAGHKLAPLGYLLHQPAEVSAAVGTPPAAEAGSHGADGGAARRAAVMDVVRLSNAAHQRCQSDEAIWQDLQDLAAGHPGIEVSRVDWSAALPTAELPRVPGSTAVARVVTREAPPDVYWRPGSFSSLTQRAHDAMMAEHAFGGGPEVDVDEAEPGVAAPPESAAAALSLVELESARSADAESRAGLVPMHDVIGGTRTGNLVHKILEIHDFQQPQDLEGIVADQLGRYGFGVELTDSITTGLQSAIEAPLVSTSQTAFGSFCLKDIGRERRMDELEFWFRVHGGFDAAGRVTSAALAAAFEGSVGPGVPSDYHQTLASQLDFTPLRGFMHGYIDLVFEHDGWWYVVDYKSNRLGPTWADFVPEAMAEEMRRAHYILQYHIYMLALHRWLGQRLPDYSYDRHIGGVFYLFVRGMGPQHSPKCGVFADRPPRSLIERLDALFEPGGPGAGGPS